MKQAILAITLAMLCGCHTLDSIGLRYILWKQDRRNTQNNAAYQKELANQARKEQLLGTWHRSYTVYDGKKFFPTEHQQTLSLFSDGTYVLRHKTSPLMTSVKTTTGTWKQAAAGVIQHDPNHDAEPFETQLNAWTNAFVHAEQQIMQSTGTEYHASLVQNDENHGLPIVVFHQCVESDVEGFLNLERFDGSFVPTVSEVIAADHALQKRLQSEKPDKTYLRQYAGFRANGKSYLWVQLTSERILQKDETLDAWGTAAYLNGFIRVNDGGDDHGEAVYDLEASEFVTISFNGNV